MICIAICDDENNMICQLRDIISKLLCKYNEQFVIDGFNDLGDLKKELLTKNRYDIIFLDIEMPNINGIEIGRYIRNELNDNTTQIVYVSAKKKYAMDLFSVRPMDFIIKPINIAQIENVLELGYKLIQNNRRMFEYEVRGELHRIEISDIYYFQSDARKIKMITSNNTIEFYEGINELYDRLKAFNFLKIHKSYIVNDAHIMRFKAHSVILDNGVELPISRNRRDEIRVRCI